MQPTRTKNSSEYAQTLEALTRYLAVRDHSRLELRQKLAGKFSEDLIERALEDATARGWLASEEEIAARAALMWQRKLKSRAYIEEQLKKRGLPIPLAEEDDLSAAKALLMKKFGDVSEVDVAKAQRYLLNRGFDDRTIKKVLNVEE